MKKRIYLSMKRICYTALCGGLIILTFLFLTNRDKWVDIVFLLKFSFAWVIYTGILMNGIIWGEYLGEQAFKVEIESVPSIKITDSSRLRVVENEKARI